MVGVVTANFLLRQLIFCSRRSYFIASFVASHASAAVVAAAQVSDTTGDAILTESWLQKCFQPFVNTVIAYLSNLININTHDENYRTTFQPQAS